jgi:hypothetical protein
MIPARLPTQKGAFLKTITPKVSLFVVCDHQISKQTPTIGGLTVFIKLTQSEAPRHKWRGILQDFHKQGIINAKKTLLVTSQ